MSAKQCHRLRTLQRERDYAKAMVAWLEKQVLDKAAAQN